MTIRAIINYLERHRVDYAICGKAIVGKSVAVKCGQIVEVWRDLTGFSKRELLTWLGY